MPHVTSLLTVGHSACQAHFYQQSKPGHRYLCFVLFLTSPDGSFHLFFGSYLFVA